MKVTYSHRRPPYWEVTADDGRWWSVSYTSPNYMITNGRGTVLDQHGPTGQKVVNAVHDYERSTRRAEEA